MRQEHWPAGLSERRRDDWDDEHGDRKTELVCIGQDLDSEAACAELEASLLTEAELQAGPSSWFAMRDLFYEAWEAEQRTGQGAHEHRQRAAAVTHVLILHKNESVPLPVAASPDSSG